MSSSNVARTNVLQPLFDSLHQVRHCLPAPSATTSAAYTHPGCCRRTVVLFERSCVALRCLHAHGPRQSVSLKILHAHVSQCCALSTAGRMYCAGASALAGKQAHLTEPLSTTVPDTPWAILRFWVSLWYLASLPLVMAARLPMPRYAFTLTPCSTVYSPVQASQCLQSAARRVTKHSCTGGIPCGGRGFGQM